jgi:hypothetical protein
MLARVFAKTIAAVRIILTLKAQRGIASRQRDSDKKTQSALCSGNRQQRMASTW